MEDCQEQPKPSQNKTVVSSITNGTREEREEEQCERSFFEDAWTNRIQKLTGFEFMSIGRAEFNIIAFLSPRNCSLGLVKERISSAWDGHEDNFKLSRGSRTEPWNTHGITSN